MNILCWPKVLFYFFLFLILDSYRFCHFFPEPIIRLHVFSVQFSSITVVSDSLLPMDCSMLGLPVHHQLPEVTQTHIPRVSDAIQPYLILCHPLLLPPSILSSIRVFSNESPLRMRWPKYWSFRFNISPCNEHPGLNSFRMDMLDLLTIERTLTSLLQHHSSKASIIWH